MTVVGALDRRRSSRATSRGGRATRKSLIAGPQGDPGRLRRRHHRPDASSASPGRSDLIWHSRLRLRGRRRGDLVSPPHLALFFGGLLVSLDRASARCGPSRTSCWTSSGFLPVLISTTLFTGDAGLHHDVPVGIHDQRHADERRSSTTTRALPGRLHRPDDRPQRAGLTRLRRQPWPYYYYTRLAHGMASMIVTTLVLLGPILLMLRRWRVPSARRHADLPASGCW